MRASKTPQAFQTWQAIKAEVSRRIVERIWQPGEFIPGEVELAEEFGCARATVNRALRELAEAGVLDRRRRVGTRVARHPVRKAILDIPITRLDIEQRGAAYCHKVLEKKALIPPSPIRQQLRLAPGTRMLHLRTMHFADEAPFLYEDRWVSLDLAPDIRSVDLDAINANEWLVLNVPLTTGSIVFSAANATAAEAKLLRTSQGTALFVVDRTTWNGDRPITSVRLAYAPGFEMRTTI